MVLGGTSGIGQAVADELAKRDCSVWAYGKEEVDVTNEAAIASAVAECSPDLVVYSPGVNVLDWVSVVSPEDFAEIMAVNLWGFVATIQSLAATGRSYSVVAVSSDAAARPMRTSLAYCCSKAALNMAVRVASRELAEEGWRINAVAPGKVNGTGMTQYVNQRVPEVRGWTPEEADRYELASTPLRRHLEPAEVAQVVADVLLSPVLGWTGDVITVNGGR